MKAGWIIGISILVVVAGIVVFRKFFARSIEFDFNLGGNAGDILGLLESRLAAAERSGERGGIYFDIPITTLVKNNGAAKVVLQNIVGSVSYDGEPIMQTRPASSALANVDVAAKSSKSITDNVQLLVNGSTIKFFQELVAGKKPRVLYNFSTMIFGKPKNFSNSTEINKNK